MNGTDATTGKPISGIAHLRQSIRDILTTPLGSRVMRRTYGSKLFSLVDKPMNQSTRMKMMAATADALAQWEPRIQLTSVTFSMSATGSLTADVTGNYLPDGTPVHLPGIVVN